MRFDFNKFVENLEPYKVTDDSAIKRNEEAGLATVVKHVWLHTPTEQINFDNFSVDDVKAALEEMEQIPLVYDDGGEVFVCEPTNLFPVYDMLFGLGYKIANIKNKRFELSEEDMFI